MARKTAIYLRSAEIAADEYRRAAKRDNETDGRALSTADVLAEWRAKRDLMKKEELLSRASDAARLSMRGKEYSAEDRKDCAAEIVWRVLASMPTRGIMPNRGDKRYDLATMRGWAQNYRRSIDRRRANDQRGVDEQSRHRASTWTDALDSIDLDTMADAAKDERALSADAADAACDRLGVPTGGAIWARLYQYASGETADRCADRLGVNRATWASRVRSGATMLRALYSESGELLTELCGAATVVASDGTLRYSLANDRGTADKRSTMAGRMTPREREGTNGGEVPERASDAAEARAASDCRHTVPVADIGAYGRSAVRRGSWHAATVAADGRRMYWWSGAVAADAELEHPETVRGIDPRCIGLGAARSMLQLTADAHRTAARLSVRKGTREKAVHYTARAA